MTHVIFGTYMFKIFVVYLEFKLNRTFCILSGAPAEGALPRPQTELRPEQRCWSPPGPRPTCCGQVRGTTRHGGPWVRTALMGKGPLPAHQLSEAGASQRGKLSAPAEVGGDLDLSPGNQQDLGRVFLLWTPTCFRSRPWSQTAWVQSKLWHSLSK